MKFLPRFDGSGRTPRPTQIQALRWLESNWHLSNVFAIQAPTGTGKQGIGTAIQLATSGAYLAPNNALVDQAVKDYPLLNFLKGRARYECIEMPDFSCADRKEMGSPPCKGCPYNACRKRALKGEPTFYNPISYFYLTKTPNFQHPEVVVVDEAHKLKDMLLLLCGVSFRRGRYNYPAISNDLDAIEWMTSTLPKLREYVKQCQTQGNVAGVKSTLRKIEAIEEVLPGLKEEPQNYAIYTQPSTYRGREDEYLHIMPIDPPGHIIRRVLGAKKIVLMSATLPKTDVRALVRGQPFLYLDLPSPIPREQRLIYYDPIPGKVNWETDPKVLADWIKTILARYPNRNTIVHVTYGLSLKLKRFFKNALVNTPETKDDIIKRFKRDGGLWLASGVSEGLDLPGDECRLNIIPLLQFANVSDPMIKKRRARQGGYLEYSINTLKTTIQQAGRSTRGADDESVTVIGDTRFPQLITRLREHVPKSFSEAIVWRKKT